MLGKCNKKQLFTLFCLRTEYQIKTKIKKKL